MFKPHISASVGHTAHILHGVVQKAEAVSHTAYLSMVAFGSHDYYIAAGCMLATVVASSVLHVVIAMAGEAQ